MPFDFPADCRTAAERAAWCLAVKRELIAAHNATADRVEKEVIALRLRIACGIVAKLKDRLGVNVPDAEVDVAAIEDSAAKLASRVTPDMLQRIDYLADKALTV